MRHFEVHVVTNRRESVLLMRAGLPPVHLEPIDCSSCLRSLGELDEIFIPVCVVLGSDSLAFLCENCLRPLFRVLDKSIPGM